MSSQSERCDRIRSGGIPVIVIIDNYDSFTYNLVNICEVLEPEIKVFRNDEITPEQIRKLNPDGIIYSPGPGKPDESGNLEWLIRDLHTEYPMLGICLGHQAIAEVFGAKIIHANEIVHGKQDQVQICRPSRLFQGLDPFFQAGRYHSLAVNIDEEHSPLQITARTEDGTVMALSHETCPVFGIQFHPESILTPDGKTILNNFIQLARTHAQNQFQAC